MTLVACVIESFYLFHFRFLSVLGSSGGNVMTRRELFNMMQRQNLPNINKKLDFLESHLLQYDDYNEVEIKEIKNNFARFKYAFKIRWSKAHKKEAIFIKNNTDWLVGTFTIPMVIKRQGRPTKTFRDSSERSKRRKTEDIRRSADVETLTYAAQVKLRTSGNRAASQILKEITASPKRAKKYKAAHNQQKKNHSCRHCKPCLCL